MNNERAIITRRTTYGEDRGEKAREEERDRERERRGMPSEISHSP